MLKYESFRGFKNGQRYVVVYGHQTVRCVGCGKEQHDNSNVYFCEPAPFNYKGDDLRFIHCPDCIKTSYCPVTDVVHGDEFGQLKIMPEKDKAQMFIIQCTTENMQDDPNTGGFA